MAGSLVFGPVELRVWCPLLRPVFSARLHVTPPLPPWTWDLQVLEGPLGRCRDSTEDNHGSLSPVQSWRESGASLFLISTQGRFLLGSRWSISLPAFQQDLALPCESDLRSVSCPSQPGPLPGLGGISAHLAPRSVLTLRWLLGDSSICAYIRSSVALAGPGTHKGWAANQGCSRGLCGEPGLSYRFLFTSERVIYEYHSYC
nr:uncharacterized protein LOC129144570 isoform X1 [Pan troglodytes]